MLNLHLMTRSEVAEKHPDELDRHEEAVKNALSWATELHPLVLKDYPHLQGNVCGCGANITNYCGGRSRECANCWEVERRLGDYLKSYKGQQFVLDLILERGLMCDPQDFYMKARW